MRPSPALDHATLIHTLLPITSQPSGTFSITGAELNLLLKAWLDFLASLGPVVLNRSVLACVTCFWVTDLLSGCCDSAEVGGWSDQVVSGGAGVLVWSWVGALDLFGIADRLLVGNALTRLAVVS